MDRPRGSLPGAAVKSTPRNLPLGRGHAYLKRAGSRTAAGMTGANAHARANPSLPLPQGQLRRAPARSRRAARPPPSMRPEAAPVEAALKATGWKLTDILVTHHHARPHRRHRGAQAAPPLPRGRARTGEAARIPLVDETVRENDKVRVGGLEARVIETPGHTAGHISLRLRRRQARLRRRHAVLDRLRPRHRGHARDDVAVAAEAARAARRHPHLLRPRIHAGERPLRAHHRARQHGAGGAREEVEQLLAAHKPTIPSTIGEEKAANPFLRADVPEVAAQIGLAGKPAAQVFAEIRERKNNF